MASRPAQDPERVQALFGRIARRYDLANTVISFGRDAAWRRRAARATGLQPRQAALDVACGTGRLAVELARLVGPAGRVVGADFSPEMLAVAEHLNPAIDWQRADALALPFADGAFDAATIAFGLRNLSDRGRGVREMARVVRGGGCLVVLEFLHPPRGAFGAGYRLYLERVLPVVGGWITGDTDAYRYLSSSIGAFLAPEELIRLAVEAGWVGVELRHLNLGTVAMLVGRSPAAPAAQH
ncbi:MAG: bifunctional demethylmenaquinone methyltransferase/2-methoxy-6-polyprenyl-1,4-benzoquinol methylase UbiE [Candidatus Dormiibacterota bacterium]